MNLDLEVDLCAVEVCCWAGPGGMVVACLLIVDVEGLDGREIYCCLAVSAPLIAGEILFGIGLVGSSFGTGSSGLI